MSLSDQKDEDLTGLGDGLFFDQEDTAGGRKGAFRRKASEDRDMRATLVQTQRHGARRRRVSRGGVWIGECLAKENMSYEATVLGA